MDRILIPEQKVEGKPLGRHILHDPRSRAFPVIVGASVGIHSVCHKGWGLPLNQGDIGSCTAEAVVGAGNTVPNHGRRKQADAVTLYKLETKNEGEPYPPNDPGGTGLEVCKAAKQLGWITAYRHAFGLNKALTALMTKPVITGVNWYETMDRPDAHGIVKVGGQVRGGHEFVMVGIDAVAHLVAAVNSWGPGWGEKGRFYFSFADWDRLLHEQGDVTVPIFA